jgi:hypothetical protein
LKVNAKVLTRAQDGSWQPGVVTAINGKGISRMMSVTYENGSTWEVAAKPHSFKNTWCWGNKRRGAKQTRRDTEIRKMERAKDTLDSIDGSMDHTSKALWAQVLHEVRVGSEQVLQQ